MTTDYVETMKKIATVIEESGAPKGSFTVTCNLPEDGKTDIERAGSMDPRLFGLSCEYVFPTFIKCTF